MEKPHIRKHKSGSATLLSHLRDNWPEYLIEMVVIVLSISASFALDEWKDNRQRQELEQLYLKELAVDISSDMNQLAGIVAETRSIIQAADTLMNFSSKNGNKDYNQFVKDVRFIFKRPRFVARDATFSNLKSTGNMQVISSFQLRNALFDYYSRYESTVLVETAELEASNTLLGPFILKRITLNKNAQKIPLASVSGEVEFQNIVLIRQATRQELLEEYEEILANGEQISALLKAQIE